MLGKFLSFVSQLKITVLCNPFHDAWKLLCAEGNERVLDDTDTTPLEQKTQFLWIPMNFFACLSWSSVTWGERDPELKSLIWTNRERETRQNPENSSIRLKNSFVKFLFTRYMLSVEHRARLVMVWMLCAASPPPLPLLILYNILHAKKKLVSWTENAENNVSWTMKRIHFHAQFVYSCWKKV